MEERVEFKDNDSRIAFFCSLKEAHNSKTWTSLARSLKLHRSQFQTYQYGTFTMPENLFSSWLNTLPSHQQRSFLKKIYTKPKHWGRSVGGKTTYVKYPEIFEKGRKATKNKLKYDFDLNLPLSEKLCEFIGAFIGDGFTNKYGRCAIIEFAGDSRFDEDYLLNQIGEYSQKLFGIPCKSYYIKNQNGMRIRFHSNKLFELLTERFKLSRGLKCYTVRIPKEILSADNKFLGATIRGIFDTDGSAFFDKRPVYKKPYIRIDLQMINPPLIQQVHQALSKLEVQSKVLKSGTRLQITGYAAVVQYLKKVGFSNQRHLQRISKYCPELLELNKMEISS